MKYEQANDAVSYKRTNRACDCMVEKDQQTQAEKLVINQSYLQVNITFG